MDGEIFQHTKHIHSLSERNKITGECLYGSHWWAREMILIDECSRDRIEDVIKQLIENKILSAFLVKLTL
ncbi:hypothetical protein GCM10023310_19760 [Paenibacillus vulneris]